MKILKTYQGSKLKEYSLDAYTDQEKIINLFGDEKGCAIIDNLKYKNTTLICKEWFDPQSLFSGTDYYIDSVQLK